MCYIVHLIAVSVMQDSECKSRDFNKRGVSRVKETKKECSSTQRIPTEGRHFLAQGKKKKKNPTVFPEFIRAGGVDKGMSTRVVVLKGCSHCQKSWPMGGKECGGR